MPSNSIAKLASALVKVQKELRPVARNAENPFFKKNYADLSACITHASPILAANGLAIIQTGKDSADGTVSIVTTLAHESGEWIDGSLTARLTKNDPQGACIAVTYLRRYGYCAMIGLSQEGEDDDGNHHATPNKPATVKQVAPTPAPVAAKPAKSDFTPQQYRDAWFSKLTALTKTNLCTEAELVEFAIETGIINENQSLGDWPDNKIPHTKKDADALLEEIKHSAQGIIP